MLFRLHYPGMQREVAEEALRLFAAEVTPSLEQLSVNQHSQMKKEISPRD
jgi:hypothetical protein